MPEPMITISISVSRNLLEGARQPPDHEALARLIGNTALEELLEKLEEAPDAE